MLIAAWVIMFVEGFMQISQPVKEFRGYIQTYVHKYATIIYSKKIKKCSVWRRGSTGFLHKNLIPSVTYSGGRMTA